MPGMDSFEIFEAAGSPSDRPRTEINDAIVMDPYEGFVAFATPKTEHIVLTSTGEHTVSQLAYSAVKNAHFYGIGIRPC